MCQFSQSPYGFLWSNDNERGSYRIVKEEAGYQLYFMKQGSYKGFKPLGRPYVWPELAIRKAGIHNQEKRRKRGGYSREQALTACAHPQTDDARGLVLTRQEPTIS